MRTRAVHRRGRRTRVRRGAGEEPGRCEKRRREKEKERRLRSSLKCVGECELVSRESPLSVAPGVPPSVILSARPYFVAHAHAPSLACTHAAVHACSRAAHRASAFRQSRTARGPAAQMSRVFFFLVSQSVTHGRRSYIAIYVFVSRTYVDLFYNQGASGTSGALTSVSFRKTVIMTLPLKVIRSRVTSFMTT